MFVFILLIKPVCLRQPLSLRDLWFYFVYARAKTNVGFAAACFRSSLQNNAGFKPRKGPETGGTTLIDAFAPIFHNR